ncbi:MAG TPA: metallophosphoesterase [Chitinophagaceae bacterium]|nr:metallophosphoesterase [Chitinophagaceae bacterium]
MLSRRGFLQQAGLATGALLCGGLSAGAHAEMSELSAETAAYKLTLLHTNDMHSRLDPFPMDGSRNAGMGGVVARAELIRQIRSEEPQVLLLDAGDIFQGTPYFNFYKGEPEIKTMSAMGYDACTMGNHDFDAGMENFVEQLGHASFPLIICNYDFSDTPMAQKYRPYKVFRKGKLKVGVTGVGIELKGLVPDALYGNTKYLDPVKHANEVAYRLKKNEGCDIVICCSHLGYKYSEKKVSDEILAKESEHIDVIIGGHTHTFMEKPEAFKNKIGEDVIVNQVGWAGLVLGRLDFNFSKGNRKKFQGSGTIVIGKKSRE